jgi:hypothetical protein
MTLKAKLDQIKAGAAQKIPPEVFKKMGAATNELRDSGIMDGVVKVGSKFPPFALSNQSGVQIRSEDLLARGAVVLTVFRGHW